MDSLYAYTDPLEALSFTEITDEPKQVWEGTVQNGVPWAVVDMSIFKVLEPKVPMRMASKRPGAKPSRPMSGSAHRPAAGGGSHEGARRRRRRADRLAVDV